MSSINTIDRKTVSRPNLVVLKYTNMPASLVETGFLTNDSDLKKLKNEEFRQKVAEVLCNAIVQSLEQIDAAKQ
jgi:N-acetylmuramoyl-L-alanine amidase